jgi:hypothetical protein
LILPIQSLKRLFTEAGLSLPPIPASLALQLQERRDWCFSTTPLERSPYAFDDFVREGIRPEVPDSLVLAHAGHGANSYALHYFLVRTPLHLFLQAAWGGAYMDEAKARSEVNECFSRADLLVAAADRAKAAGLFQPGERLIVVASSFSGGFWCKPGEEPPDHRVSPAPASPCDILNQAVAWMDQMVARQLSRTGTTGSAPRRS